MLFAVLRTVMPDAADDITDFLYKKGKFSLGEKNEYRLTAREEDADFFRTHIQEPGGIAQLVASTEKLKDSRLRYRENATLLLEKAKTLSPDDRNALWKFLANDCSLVVISTPDLEAAYRIFSVLNNRGLDLAPIDIIKAEVLGSIRRMGGEDEAHTYSKKWSEIESRLGRDAFGELFGHIRSIYAKQKQRATLVKEFKERVSEYKNPIDLVDEVIKPYAKVWGFVRNADFEVTEYAEKINEHLSWLNRVDFKDWVPPALLYSKRFRQQPKLLVAFFKALERLTYFLLVTKVGINERIEIYAALTKEIEPDAFTGDLAALTTLTLSDAQKRKFVKALDGNVYDDLPKARMALVLRLESLRRDDGGAQLQDAVSLEHVLPQTPPDGSDWIKWFPDKDERDYWMHRLANLVPLDRKKNSSARNCDFAKKKKVYSEGKGTVSPFVLTREVWEKNEWTPTLLAERQKFLVALFKRHWNLAVSTDTEAS